MDSPVFVKYKVFSAYKHLLHEGDVVETKTMSLVEPVGSWLNYAHSIPESLLKLGGSTLHSLSGVQMDSVVFSGAAHSRFLPNGKRVGFLLGDGAGVGKGRQIAAIILDNYMKGRRKAVWVSSSPHLIKDAQRDMKDVLGKLKVMINVFNLPNNFMDIEEKSGVLFVTYMGLTSLRRDGEEAQAKFEAKAGNGGKANVPLPKPNKPKIDEKHGSRLQQIMAWLGSDFDGVIIFDESHKAKGYTASEKESSSETGKYVKEIQRRLKLARIVYVSATIATEPSEMQYMERLGLWGPGTVFQTANAFVEATEVRGVCGSELVAVQLKQRGLLLSRHLSFEGIQFDKISAVLDDNQRKLYDTCVIIWQCMFKLIRSDPERKKLKSAFWALHQRFFRNLCVGLKLPKLLELLKEKLNGEEEEDRHAVIIGLQSTGEAAYRSFKKSKFHEENEACRPCEIVLEEFLTNKLKLSPSKLGLKPKLSAQAKAHPIVLGSSNPRKFTHGQKESESSEESGESSEEDSEESSEENSEESSEDSEESSEDSEESSEDSEESEDEQKCEAEVGDCAGNRKSRKKKLPVTKRTAKADKPPRKIAKTEEVGDLDFDFVYEATDEKELENYIIKIFNFLVGKLPFNPIDELIMRYTKENVAELTGRNEFQMLVERPGRMMASEVKRSVKGGDLNIMEQSNFQEGKSCIAVISDASSTGISLHSYSKFKNQLKRTHIIAETPWSATQAIQQMGRTNRTGQIHQPEYLLLDSGVSGERRFVATLAKRVMTLGAICKGDRRSSQRSIWKDQLLEPAVARVAIKNLINHIICKESNLNIFGSQRGSDVVSIARSMETMEIIIKDKDKNLAHNPKMLNIEKFLNRIIGMRIRDQHKIMLWLDTAMEKCKSLEVCGADAEAIIEDVSSFNKGVFEIHKVLKYKLPDGETSTLTVFNVNDVLEWSHVRMMKGVQFYKRVKKSQQMKIVGVVLRECLNKERYLEVFAVKSKTKKTESVHYLREKGYKDVAVEEAKFLWIQLEEFYKLRCNDALRTGECRKTICEHDRPFKKVGIVSGCCFTLWAFIEKFLNKQIRIASYESEKLKTLGIFIPHNCLEKVEKEIEMISKMALEQLTS